MPKFAWTAALELSDLSWNEKPEVMTLSAECHYSKSVVMWLEWGRSYVEMSEAEKV